MWPCMCNNHCCIDSCCDSAQLHQHNCVLINQSINIVLTLTTTKRGVHLAIKTKCSDHTLLSLNFNHSSNCLECCLQLLCLFFADILLDYLWHLLNKLLRLQHTQNQEVAQFPWASCYKVYFHIRTEHFVSWLEVLQSGYEAFNPKPNSPNSIRPVGWCYDFRCERCQFLQRIRWVAASAGTRYGCVLDLTTPTT